MQFTTQTTRSVQQIKTPALIIGVYTDKQLSEAASTIDMASEGSIQQVLKKEFKAKLGTTLVLRNLSGVSAERIVLVGLGDKADYNANAILKAHSAAAEYLKSANLSEGANTLLSEEATDVPLIERARLAARAFTLATYQYDTTFSKSPDPISLKKLICTIDKGLENEVKQGLAQGSSIGNGMNLTRHLGNLPANYCTPTFLGNQAKVLAKEFKTLQVEVLEKKQIEALKMGSFLSVAAGSDQAPRFIIIKYKPAGKNNNTSEQKPIVLVGKGVTFDTGGISLKPGLGMDEMKYDMCGAATVLGTMRTIAELGLPQEVIGLIPATENMPNGHATKPGDVVTSMSGQTIEILNTDAEGRLILCDALTYAERFKPELVIDVATLTGAIIVSLGYINTGVFANNDALAQELVAAGKQANDTAWHMPMQEPYQEQLKSNFADMANIGGMPGGSVTAACFLSRFTKAYPWAHLDIAGTAWTTGKDKGASGRPVPLLIQFLLNRHTK